MFWGLRSFTGLLCWILLLGLVSSFVGCRSIGSSTRGSYDHTPNRPLPTHLGALLEHPTVLDAQEIWITLPIIWKERFLWISGHRRFQMVSGDRLEVGEGNCHFQIDQLKMSAQNCRIKWIDGEDGWGAVSIVARGGIDFRFGKHRVKARSLLVDQTTLQYQGEVTARVGREADEKDR
ncbi:MAG: hypothetical protein QF752_15525 [Planctomycetota bacterium]|jgi:hypothetical protein|nr:hypothetical protein [Planctomycetota bacterium]